MAKTGTKRRRTSRFLIATACLANPSAESAGGDCRRSAASQKKGASNDGDCSRDATYGVQASATNKK
jgi:hypothetical protein